MALEKPIRISSASCPECGKRGAEVYQNGSHRCRYCGNRWTPETVRKQNR